MERLNTRNGCAVAAAFLVTLTVFGFLDYLLTDYRGVAQEQYLAPVDLLAAALLEVDLDAETAPHLP